MIPTLTSATPKAADPARRVGRESRGFAHSNLVSYCASYLDKQEVRLIEFHLDSRSGVAPYLQLIQQVRQALRLGLLREGDRLPTVKEVSGALAINPNTVLKAYRELEYEGLAAARPGVGTFVTKTVNGQSVEDYTELSDELTAWFRKAHEAGLDHESIEAIFQRTYRSALQEEVI
jgi:GntR family transcriptional regulator